MTVDSAQLEVSSSNYAWYRDRTVYEGLGPMMMLYGTFLGEIHGSNVASALTIGGVALSFAASKIRRLTKPRMPYVDRDASGLCWTGWILSLLGVGLAVVAWMLGLQSVSRLYGVLLMAVGQVMLVADAPRSYR